MNNIGFYTCQLSDDKYFVSIEYGSRHIYNNHDEFIPKLLDISIQKYEELLTMYGAKRQSTYMYTNEIDSTMYMFKTGIDAIKFRDYLNNKYLILLKLVGKI